MIKLVKYNKFDESLNSDHLDFNDIEKLFWIRSNFYNRISFFKEKISEFEKCIDGVFYKKSYKSDTNIFELKLGILYGRKIGCTSASLFDYESDVILGKMNSKSTVELKSTIDRINVLSNSIKDICPIYRFTGDFSIDKDVSDDLILTNKSSSSSPNNRYVKWMRKHMEDILPNCEFSIRLYYGGFATKIVIEIADTKYDTFNESLFNDLLSGGLEINIKDCDYYKNVSNDFLELGIYTMIVSFDNREKDIILDVIDSYINSGQIEYGIYRLSNTLTNNLTNYIIISSSNYTSSRYEFSVEIFKVHDDYYYVSLFYGLNSGRNIQRSYKCDQIDGLVNLLKEVF